MGQARGIEVQWNQRMPLIPNRTVNGVSLTQNGGINYLNGTCTATGNIPFGSMAGLGYHDKIYIHPSYGSRLDFTYFVSLWSTETYGDIVNPVIIDDYTAGIYPAEKIIEGAVFNNFPLNNHIINLTQMFEGYTMLYTPTAAEFESWLQENGINPNEYIPYNSGETRIMTKPSWIV